MRLISCHIENFGKLSNENISFEDGLNVTLRDNGWGKSTLSVFIRAMFYGLFGDGKRDDIQCERKRYAPWQGGAFGGSLTFAIDNKQYTVTRFFAAKPADDSFELRDAVTNIISNDYSENLGEEIFKINGESFARTVYVMQSDCFNTYATDDINAKLGNISDGIDLNRYAMADEALKDALNAFSATRKTGTIARLKASASELKGNILKGNGIEAVIADLQQRISVTTNEIGLKQEELKALGNQKIQAAQNEKLISDRRTYESLSKEIAEKEASLNIRKEYFKDRVPSKETCEEWERVSNSIDKSEAIVRSAELTDSEKNIYQSLLTLFNEELPDSFEIDELVNEANKLNQLRRDSMANGISHEDEERVEQYTRQYGDILTAKQELTETIEAWNDRTLKVSEIRNLENEIKRYELERDEESKELESNTKAPGWVKLLIILLVIFEASLGVIIWMQFVAVSGPVMVVAGGAALLVLLVAIIEKKLRKSDDTAIRELDERILDIKDTLLLDKRSAQEIEKIAAEILNEHGLEYSGDTAFRNLQNLLIEAHELENLLSRVNEKKKRNLDGECELLSKKIKDYLIKYNVVCAEDEYPAKLIELKGKLNHFRTLNIKVSEAHKEKVSANELRQALTREMELYYIPAGIDISKRVDEVFDIVTEYDSLMEAVFEAKKRMKAFEESVDIAALVNEDADSDVLSLDELTNREALLNADIDTLRRSLSTDSKNLDAFLEEFDEWREQKDRLSELEEEINIKLDKLDTIAMTEEYLSKAKEKLTARYIDPLLKGFTRYYCLLTKEDGSEYHIDANMVITKDEKGKQRSTQALSAGYQDLIGFCMRLATVDAMYESEKPVLILDDPFVNLDEKKLNGAKELLNEASKDYQIIYLTCKEDRI